MQKNYNIKVYNKAGTYIRTISPSLIMNGVSFSSQINGGMGEMRVQIKAEIDSNIIEKTNILKVYESSDESAGSRVIYTGIVGNLNRISTEIANYIEARCIGLSSMLSWGYYDDAGTYVHNKNQEPATTLKNIIDRFAVKYPSHPTDGLLGYYPFNGNANDESGNGYNGTVNGAILTTDRFGNANRAYSFNGSSDYISIGDVINPGLGNLSFSAWFNTTTAGAFQSILTKSRAAGANGRYGVMFTGGTLYSFIDFDIGATIWNVTTPEAPYIDGNWHNVCVTIQRNGNLTMYVDGINKGAIDISAHVATNCTSTDILGIGAYNNSTGTALTQGFFNGKIGITSLYNRVLKEEEIQKIYIGGLISYTGSSVENFGASSDIAFDYTKSLDALTKTAETTDFWWHIDREGVLQFHPKTGAVGQLHHKLDDGNDIIDINVEENSENVVNKYILFYTGGNVTAEDLTSQATYGIRERKDTKTEITNATTANATASAYIEANKDQKRRIRISINTNYDIESIRPGDLITVRNISYNISGLQINKIEYNPDNITVELDDVLSFGKEVFTS